MGMMTLEAPDAPFRLAAPINHITELPDGSVVVHCIVTSESPDSQGEIIDYDAAKAAAPGFLKWARLTEMHDNATSPGTALRLHFDDDQRRIEADLHVVDPVAVQKVKARVYKAVSMGGTKLATRVVQVAGKAYRKITNLVWEELALVNAPANSDAIIAKRLVLAKRDDTVPEETTPEADDRSPEQIAIDTTREMLAKRDIPAEEREDIESGDFAGKDRSFPIAKPEDVAAAASSIGRAGPDNYTTDELKARIIAIARRKGPAFEAKLPKAWRKGTAKMKKAQVPTEAKEDEDPKGEAPVEVAVPDVEPPQDRSSKPRKARKMSKKARMEKMEAFAKEGDKTIKMLGIAAKAIAKAIACEAQEHAEGIDNTEHLNRLRSLQNAISEVMVSESVQVRDEEGGMEDEYEDEMMEMAKAYGSQALRDITSVPDLKARLAKMEQDAKKTRAKTAKLRKQRKVLANRVVKKSAEIKALTKASASPAPEPVVAAAEGEQIAKSEVAPLDTVSMLKGTLEGLMPATKLTQMEAILAAVAERQQAQGELIAKIAQQPTSGGPATPYSPVFRGMAPDMSDKESVLATAATVIKDPRLQTEVGRLAAFEGIKRQRGS